MHGGLTGRVAGADHDDLRALQRSGLRRRSAVEHTAADERFERRDVQSPIRHSACEDDGIGGGDGAITELQAVGSSRVESGDAAGQIECGTEASSLDHRPPAELPAGDSAGNPR